MAAQDAGSELAEECSALRGIQTIPSKAQAAGGGGGKNIRADW